MKSHPLLTAFLAPLLLTAGLAVIASVLGFFASMIIALAVALSLVVGLVGMLITALACIDASARHGAPGPRLALSIFSGLLAGALLFLPMTRAADEGVRQAKAPVRAALAQRVVERGRQAGWTQPEAIRLGGLKSLLSDGGEITVYSDEEVTAVWFWDVRGILDSYSATVYVSDPGGRRVPASLKEAYEVEHHSGHWWRAVPE